MEAKSVSKNTGISARKMKLVVDMVRGKSVNEALTILKFTPTPHAKLVARTVKTAAADAEKNQNANVENLKIKAIYADEAMTMRRYRARARGRAGAVKRRSSHVTVVVGEQEG
ncbi:MAG TPA: 50S ribosomal protein L22 [Dehalococcoidales bacterium]|nr:50S ribosomal protein L22 [Dehalococcoidales bacterium]